MSAVPGLPPVWPRRRRVAGFARGSASGGVVSIPVAVRDRGALRQQLLDRVRTLPGVTTHATGQVSPVNVRLALEASRANGPPESFLAERELAEITADGEVLLRLPRDTCDDLLRAGWVQGHGADLRVPCARQPAETEVIWRILLCAYEYATGAPNAAPGARDGGGARRQPAALGAPAETSTAV